MIFSHGPFKLPKDRRLRISSERVLIDIPGPYSLEWSWKTAEERVTHVKEHPIPVATGVAFVATPYVVGAGIVAFAPPPFKVIGAAMLVPNPVADVAYFGLGYSVGLKIEDMFK